MKVLVIEDEYRNFNRLQKMLLNYDITIQIEGPLESVVETREWLLNHQGDQAPDIVFSDIRLSDGICFDAFDMVSSSTALVFTTAYDEYALQAFRFNGLAYLMKPIEAEELRATLDRIHQIKWNSEDLKQLISQMQASQYKYRERFLVPYKDGYEVINVRNVSHICTEYKDTRIYLNTGKFYSISMTLEELENQLNPAMFFRVNRQYIVNIDTVNGLKTYFGGKLRVMLSHYKNIEIICSRDRASQLKDWLGK